jgi:hypothetical protein
MSIRLEQNSGMPLVNPIRGHRRIADVLLLSALKLLARAAYAPFSADQAYRNRLTGLFKIAVLIDQG